MKNAFRALVDLLGNSERDIPCDGVTVCVLIIITSET